MLLFRPRVIALLLAAIVASVVGICYLVGYNPFKQDQIQNLRDNLAAVQQDNQKMNQLGKDVAIGKVSITDVVPQALGIFKHCQPHEWAYEAGWQAALKTISATDLKAASLPDVNSVNCQYLPGQAPPATKKE